MLAEASGSPMKDIPGPILLLKPSLLLDGRLFGTPGTAALSLDIYAA